MASDREDSAGPVQTLRLSDASTTFPDVCKKSPINIAPFVCQCRVEMKSMRYMRYVYRDFFIGADVDLSVRDCYN